MTLQRKIGQAILDELNGDHIRDIARRLIGGAKAGDHEAMKTMMVLAQLVESAEAVRQQEPDPEESCSHPPDMRMEFPVMGSVRKERCQCGASLINGKVVDPPAQQAAKED